MIIRYNVILPYSIACSLVLDWAEKEGPIGTLGVLRQLLVPFFRGQRRRLAPSSAQQTKSRVGRDLRRAYVLIIEDICRLRLLLQGIER